MSRARGPDRPGRTAKAGPRWPAHESPAHEVQGKAQHHSADQPHDPHSISGEPPKALSSAACTYSRPGRVQRIEVAIGQLSAEHARRLFEEVALVLRVHSEADQPRSMQNTANSDASASSASPGL